jgi:hypothetical protein
MFMFLVFGVLAVLFGVLALGVAIATSGNQALGGHSLAPIVPLAVFFVVVGVGMCFLKRWAAALFAGILAIAGVCITIGSVVSVPLPELLINLIYSGILLVPSVVTARRWSEFNRND